MNNKYELFGGILYNTPVDETVQQIQSTNFIRAKEIADTLLAANHISAIYCIKLVLNDTLVNYMNSPLIDIIYNTENPNEWLIKAVELGNLKIIQYFLDRGCNIAYKIKYVDCPLSIACGKGNMDVIKYLMDNGAKEYLVSSYALTRAAQHGHLEVIKYLIDQGADIHRRNDPMEAAAGYGQLEIVKYFVEQHGVSVNRRYAAALQDACIRGHLAVVKYLVKHGADININALEEAAFWGQFEVVIYLCSGQRHLRPGSVHSALNRIKGESILNRKITQYLEDYMRRNYVN